METDRASEVARIQPKTRGCPLLSLLIECGGWFALCWGALAGVCAETCGAAAGPETRGFPLGCTWSRLQLFALLVVRLKRLGYAVVHSPRYHMWCLAWRLRFGPGSRSLLGVEAGHLSTSVVDPGEAGRGLRLWPRKSCGRKITSANSTRTRLALAA